MENNPTLRLSVQDKNKYMQWRKSIFFSIFISWATFHFVRKCFAAIIPCLKTDLGFSVTQIGLIGSAFYITYAMSKLIAGYVADRSNTRYFLFLSLLVSGVVNIILGAFGSLYLMALLLMVSAFFQAAAWPSCTKLLTFWCTNKERGKWWGLCGMGQNLGAGLVPLFAGFMSEYFGWQWAMYLSGVLSILMSFLMLKTVRDLPTSMGLPLLESDKGQISERRENLSKPRDFFEAFKTQILTNRTLVVFSMSGLFLYVVRNAVNDWIPLYLMEEKGYQSLLMANGTVSWFEFGGFLGGVTACWTSDTIFNSNRIASTTFFSFLLILSVVFFSKFIEKNVILDSCFMGVIGFVIFGIQGMFGLATSEMVDKNYAGTANSFGGFVSNLGAAMSAYPLALALNYCGWNGFFYVIIGCAVFTLIFTKLATYRHKGEQKQVSI